MLGKLIKYEFRSTGPIFALMYAALLALAAVNSLLMSLGDSRPLDFGKQIGPTVYSIIASITSFLYILVCAAVIIMTIVIVVMRFYRMFGNEGYLWHTLPVKADQHIIAKLLVSFVWAVASCLALLISIGLLTIRTGWIFKLYRIGEIWNQLVSYGFHPELWLILLVVFLIANWLSGILMFYAATAIGPNIIKSRLGGSVLAYIICYIGMQIAGSVLLIALMFPLRAQAEFIASNHWTLMNLAGVAQASEQIMILTVGSFSLFSLVCAVVLYILTRYFMSRKLNLP